MTKCDIKKCRNISLETGRFISELSSKAMSQPVPTVQDKDIERLGHYLDTMEQGCGITDDHIKRISRYYDEIKNIYPSVRRSRLASPLADLLDTIYSANSDCIKKYGDTELRQQYSAMRLEMSKRGMI